MSRPFRTVMWKRIFYRVLLLPLFGALSYVFSIDWLLWILAFIALGLFSEIVTQYLALKKKKTACAISAVFLAFVAGAFFVLPDWDSALTLGAVFGTACVSLYWSVQQYKWVLRKMAVQKQTAPVTYEQLKDAYQFDVSELRAQRATMRFVKSLQPITEAITKFGGQPVWIDKPQWPLGKMSNKPMRFIGQIQIEEKLFGKKQAQMAYIFYSEGIDENTDTFEIEGGENAVILQPGTPLVPVVAQETGPTIEGSHNKSENCEFRVELKYGEDPTFIPEYDLWVMDEKERDRYYKAVEGKKIGGVPSFYQADEFPDNTPWQLLMQMDDEALPGGCYLNFGTGMAYAMINPEGTKARFFWQC